MAFFESPLLFGFATIVLNFQCSAINITVCPADHVQSSAKPTCQSFDRSVLYPDQSPCVLLVHSGSDWTAVVSAAKVLSRCGFSSAVFELPVYRSEELRFSSTCLASRTLLILGFQDSCHQDNCAAEQLLFSSRWPNSAFLNVHNISCGLVSLGATNAQPGLTVYTKNRLQPPFGDDTVIRNKTLCVTTIPDPASSFVRAVPSKDGGETVYEGMVIRILDRMAQDLGFKYNLVIPSDEEYGVMQDNGSFTGMAGMLQRRECDVVANDFSVTYGRSRVLDYSSVPFHYDAVGILINMPEGRRQGLKLWNWSSPFEWKLWICFVIMLFVVASLFYLGHRYGGKEVWAHRQFVEIGNCFMYIGSCYVNQGLNIHPKSWWAATLLAFWWLLCLLEIASYSSFLISVLTAPPPVTLPFESLEELVLLLQKGDYKACVQSGTSFYDETQNSDSTVLLQLGRWLKRNPSYVQHDPQACIGLVLKSTNVAYLAELVELEAFERMHCRDYSLLILPQRFSVTMYAFAFQKGSPYTAPFSSKLLEIIGDGLVGTWYQNYSKGRSCDVTDTAKLRLIHASHQTLSLYDMGGVFVLFFIGVCLSLVFVTLERGVIVSREEQNPVGNRWRRPTVTTITIGNRWRRTTVTTIRDLTIRDCGSGRSDYALSAAKF